MGLTQSIEENTWDGKIYVYNGSVVHDVSKITHIRTGKFVTEIKDRAFRSFYRLRYLDISDRLRSIGKSSFRCTELQEINFITVPPSSSSKLISIGDEAFSGCRAIQKIDIPDGIRMIGVRAFSDCRSMTEIHLPRRAKVEIIEEGTFEHCANLIQIALPDSVKEIKKMAFYKCINLSTVYLPDSLEVIGSQVFF